VQRFSESRATRGSRDSRRRSAFAIGVLVVVAAVLIPVGLAGGSQNTKYYDACLSVTGAGTCGTQNLAAGTKVSLTLTLTNRSSYSTTLGSADLSAPSGFAIDPASATPPSNVGTWSTPGELDLRNLNLAPGAAASVTFDVTTPCTVSGYAKWGLTVKPTSDYSGSTTFTAKSANGLSSTVVAGGGGSNVTQFVVTLPSPSFTATAGQVFTPTVTAKNGCGTATGFNGTATLTSTLGPAPDPLPAAQHSPTPVGVQSGGAGATISFLHGVSQPSVTAVAAQTGRTLTATYGAATGSSPVFDVIAGAAAQLAFTQQPPAKTSTNTQFSVATKIEDAFGNPTNGSGNVQLTLIPPADPTAGGVNAHLTGTTSVSPSGGTATFAGLAVDTSGVGYTLRATQGSLSATSNAFDVLDTLTPCGPSGCSASTTTSLASISVSGPDTSGSLGVGLSTPPATSTCTLLNGQTKSISTIGSAFQIVPPARTGADPFNIKVTLTVFNSQKFPWFVPVTVCKSYAGQSGLHEVPWCPFPSPIWLLKPKGAPFACIAAEIPTWHGDTVITMLINSTDPWGHTG
jgi:hypothetical protein